MGLFDKLKKTAEPQPPFKSGTIEKTPSFIMLIPKDDSLLDDIDALMKKLLEFSDIKVISKKLNDGFELALEYSGEEYKFSARIDEFSLPELFRVGHDFTDEEIESMESAKRGLISKMTFGTNNSASFHLQIKLLCAMIGEPAGIVDYSGERMLSGRWAKLAARSEVPPSPDYLYVMQCVSGDDGKVWIHTHGLNRCGGIELEILESDKEHYSDQANVIITLAKRIVSESVFIDEYEPIYVIRLSQDTELVATWISWERAIKMYPKKMLGGAEDRQDGHNENTGAVFVYKDHDDCENKKLSHVGIYNDLLTDNPIMMITSEETDRMRRLAMERLDYMKALFEDNRGKENIGVLIKVGLEVDDEFKDGDMQEHIWFELKELREDGFTAELTQDAFYVKALKTGDIRECRYDEITDWVVFLDGDRITPDSVYRLIR